MFPSAHATSAKHVRHRLTTKNRLVHGRDGTATPREMSGVQRRRSADRYRGKTTSTKAYRVWKKMLDLGVW